MSKSKKAKAASNRFYQMSVAIDDYCDENNLKWLGCMENNDELIFCPCDEIATVDNMTSMWWIATKSRLGTFQEYCDEPQ